MSSSPAGRAIRKKLPQGSFFVRPRNRTNNLGCELEKRKQAKCLFSDDRRRLLLSQLAKATRSEKLQPSDRSTVVERCNRETYGARRVPPGAPLEKKLPQGSFFVHVIKIKKEVLKLPFFIHQYHNPTGEVDSDS